MATCPTPDATAPPSPVPSESGPGLSESPGSCYSTPPQRRYRTISFAATPEYLPDSPQSLLSDSTPARHRHLASHAYRKSMLESPYLTRRRGATSGIRARGIHAKSPRKHTTKWAWKRLEKKKYLLAQRLERPAPVSAKFRMTAIPGANFQNFVETWALIWKETMRILFWTLRVLVSPIATWIVFLLLVLLITFSISATVYGICALPGATLSTHCLKQVSASPPSPVMAAKPQVDYSNVVTIQNKLFDQLLETASGGSALSLEIKRAQMVTKDLMAHLKVSKLDCKDSLLAALEDFEKDAQTTAHGLRQFAARVGGSADHVLAAGQFALQTIAGAQASRDTFLTRLLPGKSHAALGNVIMERYREVLSILTAQMKRLTLEAEKSHINLVDLEDRLTAIYEIVVRSDSVVSEEMSGVLEQFWTRLGGNRQALRQFGQHLALLKALEGYRKQALAHVVAALETLHAMSAEMKEIQERFTGPSMGSVSVPVDSDVLLRSILVGITRLQEGRTRAKRAEDTGFRDMLSGTVTM